MKNIKMKLIFCCTKLVEFNGFITSMTIVTQMNPSSFWTLKRPHLTLSPENYSLQGTPYYKVVIIYFNWDCQNHPKGIKSPRRKLTLFLCSLKMKILPCRWKVITPGSKWNNAHTWHKTRRKKSLNLSVLL